MYEIKNFSLIETAPCSGRYMLSPAYDLLPVNVIMPEDKEQLALAMNGKKRNIRRKDFLVFAEKCGLTRTSADKMMMAVIRQKDTFRAMCEESLLPNRLKERFAVLIEQRIDILQG